MKKVIAFIVVLTFVLALGCAKQVQEEVSVKVALVNADGTVHIEGRGRAFENTIGIKITDGYNFVLYQGSVITNAKEMGQFGDFSLDAKLNIFPQTDKISVTAFITSPKDGTITSSSTKELNYNYPYKVVKVFYGNTKLNQEMLDCSKVFAVDRRISSNSSNPPLDTMKIFLLGPTQKEKDEGYLMSTPQNLTINKIEKISSNKVQIDFGKELLDVTGGSCKVTAIRSEITQTLLQFFPGYEVIISANGNAEEVLQP